MEPSHYTDILALEVDLSIRDTGIWIRTGLVRLACMTVVEMPLEGKSTSIIMASFVHRLEEILQYK